MPLEIKRAVRRALPLQIAFYGPSGSGKTFSALMFAAGLAGDDGKVVVIDSERGRASLYADNKKILAALPQGFDVVEIGPNYHPKHYIEALELCEKAGYRVCLIDSLSDSWDGPGGSQDLAEANKGMWNIPKLWNKRMMTTMALSDMHTICCLKAQEKTKIIDKAKSGTGKQEYVDLGVQPVCEKNAFFPMLLGFSVDPKTHLSAAVKCHDDLVPFFPEPKLITKEDGVRIREWNTGAVAQDPWEQLRKRARASADEGMESYTKFFAALKPPQKKALVESTHAENKRVAEQADAARKTEAPRYVSWDEWERDGAPAHETMIVGAEEYRWNEESGSHKRAHAESVPAI